MSTDPRIEAAATALGERIDMHLPSAFDDGCLAHDGSHCEDDGDCIQDMATAALAAADKAATIMTVEELDALGFEAVVLDPCGTPAVCQRSAPGFNEWALGGSGELIDSETLLLSGSSCTVLHRGTE